MKGYANQSIIDSGAFMLAKHIAANDWTESRINEFLSDIGKAYRRDYRDDNWFEGDVRYCAVFANEMAGKTYRNGAQRAAFLHECYLISKNFEPDGSKRKKFLGIFGGTRFTGNHKHPADRKTLFEKNCVRYFVMTIAYQGVTPPTLPPS
jgi:hypothetical protein